MEIFEALGLSEKNLGVSLGDGEFISGGPEIESYNPTTGEVLGVSTMATDASLERVLIHAERTAKSWRSVPAPKRGELVRLIGEALREHKSALGSLVALEMGKSKQEGDGEVQEMIDMADFAVGQSRMLYGLSMHSERPSHRMMEQWHPLGVVGVITAFNFPVAVWAWNAFIAAICGNTVVWKPSPKAPLCSIAVQHIVHKVMTQLGYEGVFSLINTDDEDLIHRFVDDKRVALVSFTGSCHIGRLVNERVARRMGRCLLELGGNNAVIIDESANLELAIPAVVFGAVGTAGQRCTTTRRLYVHQSLYDDVCGRLAHAFEQVTIGDPLDERNLMGPLTDEAAVGAYSGAIARAKTLGAEVLFGGDVLDTPGFFVQPTLLKAEHAWDVVHEETFAPILYVMPFDRLEDAIALQNDVPQGLSSALFTDRITAAETFLSSLGSDCGIANINIGTSGAEIGGAFGGEKDTGGGREAGSDAWKAYMRRQTVTINWGRWLPLAQGINFSVKS